VIEPAPDLRYHSTEVHDKARAALASGDVRRFLALAPNDYHLPIIFWNRAALRSAAVIEEAFAIAVTSTRSNNRLHYYLIDHILPTLERTRLRSVGSPPPGPGPWRVYRGVSGRGAARRIRGYSWTAALDRARWFAARFGLPDPAVFETTVHDEHLLFYTNERSEREFVVALPRHWPVRRVERVGCPERPPVEPLPMPRVQS
jgi:hypothetical protein